jgi:epidermal growth factor receptor substrate 15
MLNLTPDEKRIFQYLFQQADAEKLGVITGEIAVKFFERTKLAPAVLGEIWQIADTENRGLLTMAGFCQVLRLIGHYQAGRDPAPELAFRRECSTAVDTMHANVHSRAAPQVRGPLHPRRASSRLSGLLSPDHGLDPAADERQWSHPRPAAGACEGSRVCRAVREVRGRQWRAVW